MFNHTYRLSPGTSEQHTGGRLTGYWRRVFPGASRTAGSSPESAPRGRAVRRLGGALLVLGAIVLAGILAGVLLGRNALRGPVATILSAKLHRPIAIQGDLEVKVSWPPAIEVNRLVVGNASWGSRPWMVQVEQAVLRIEAAPLLRGRIVVSELQLVKPILLLERNAAGEANWTFGKAQSLRRGETIQRGGDASAPEIGSLKIRDGQLDFRDAKLRIDLHLAIDSDTAPQTGSVPTIRFAGHGNLREQPFQLEGRAVTALALKGAGQPYYLDIRATSGETKAAFKGTLVPMKLGTIDGMIELSGKDLAKLDPIVPVPVPWTPAYTLVGYLERQGEKWSIREFRGRMGRSDLSGRLSLDRTRSRPVLVADLTSKRLDYADIGVFLGAPPPAGEDRTPEQQQEAAKRAVTGKVLPSKPFNLARLREIDADVRFRGESIVAPNLPLDTVVAHLQIQQGLVTLTPLDFGVAGGHVVSSMKLDARADVIDTTADVTVRDLELKALLPKLKENPASAGKIGGRAKLHAKGNSVAQMAGSADGEVALIMSGGQVSTLDLMLANLDLANAATLLLRGEKNAPVHCMVTNANLRSGWLEPEFFVVDSSESVITAEGGVDMRQEQYQLRLVAHSKRSSLVALRAPIRVEGTFKHPEVRPEAVPVAGRAAAAIALGALLTPAAALLALVDPGGAEDRDCAALIARAKQEVAR